MVGGSLVVLAVLCDFVLGKETTTVSAAETLGTLFRQARSEQYGYASKYGSDSSVTSGAIGIRGEPVEHRDAAYFESRCITCGSNKPLIPDRGWRQRTRMGYYDDDLEDRKYRDRDDEYYDRASAMGYAYERPRGPGLSYERDRPRAPGYDYDRPRMPPYDYDRSRSPPLEYDRTRMPMYDYDRPDPYTRNEISRPVIPAYSDRNEMRYDRDRNYYDPRYDRTYDRGNGYDNLDQRYQLYGSRYDRNMTPRRPIDPVDPYASRYDRYDRYDRNNYGMRYDPYDRYDAYERSYWRRPIDDRYSMRSAQPDVRGYYASGVWGPGYDRGYASAWNYPGLRDNWRDVNRDRDPGNGDNWRDLNRDRDSGAYRPRDYFYDSTAAPGSGGSRVTSYIHDRPESSTKPDSGDRDKPTSSPQA